MKKEINEKNKIISRGNNIVDVIVNGKTYTYTNWYGRLVDYGDRYHDLVFGHDMRECIKSYNRKKAQQARRQREKVEKENKTMSIEEFEEKYKNFGKLLPEYGARRILEIKKALGIIKDDNDIKA